MSLCMIRKETAFCDSEITDILQGWLLPFGYSTCRPSAIEGKCMPNADCLSTAKAARQTICRIYGLFIGL